MKLPSLSILIPCYNVEDTIEAVINDASEVGNKIAQKIEIIALNDASSDTTASILRRLQQHIPALSVLTHRQNQGYGRTIKNLYLKGRYTWLFSLPGDGQFDARELIKLLPYVENADMILGWRKTRRDSQKRLMQSKVYNSLLSSLFGVSFHDVNTIRLMKKRLIQSVSMISSSAFVDAELTISAKRLEYRIVEVPINHKKRQSKGATGGKLFKTILPTIMDMIRFRLSTLRFTHA